MKCTGESSKQQRRPTVAGRNVAQIGDKRVRFEDRLVDINDEPPTPGIKKPPPTVFPGKNVFLESYSNSPEWTRFENPVINMEEEILPEELEDENLPEQLQYEESPVTRCEGREPGFKRDQQRRHPLSQVTNAGDMVSPLQDRLDLEARQQGDGRLGAPVFISDDNEEQEDFCSHASADSGPNAPISINNDELEEEEPEDDTFDFLFK